MEALWSALLGRGEPALLDQPCPQPPRDQPPAGECADRRQQVIMVDVVEFLRRRPWSAYSQRP
jgi:hypothetical protein